VKKCAAGAPLDRPAGPGKHAVSGRALPGAANSPQFRPIQYGGLMRHIGRFLSGRETPSAGDYVLALAATGGLMVVTVVEMLV
jgi:hypothetical protein